MFTISFESGQTGGYLFDVYDVEAQYGDTILVNVSYGGCAGNNSVIVNNGPPQRCDVTIYGNLPPAIPNQPSGPTEGYKDVTYTYSTNTTDPDGDDVYYWFDWGDGTNSSWVGPYTSGATGNASHSWSNSGTYQVKAKAKDVYGAELGTLWSDPLNVTISSPNNPPNTPSNPSPSNGATNVELDADLSWTGGDPDGDNVTYNVYFEANDPTPDELVSENQSDTSYDPGTMEFGTTYYWKIVAWDNHGASTTGPIWSFTTKYNNPPNTPSNPDPYDGETNVDVDHDLSWTGGDPDPGDTVTYDIYFEADDPTPDVMVSNNQSGTTYDLGTMDGHTQYYWQIIAWDNHGATATGPIWSFTTENNPPYTPSNPNPANHATGVDINADLSWTCSDPDGDNLTYNVYFEANDPTPDEIVSENQTGTTYDPGAMDYNTHYYWQIVAWDEYGASTTGPVWDFTTGSEPNDPPHPPSDPDPEDGDAGVSVDAMLSWNCSDPDGDPLVYDVYLKADDPTPDILVSDDQTGTTYDPEGLAYGTTYYWQIIAKDSHSATTPGPVWHFTTEEAVPDLDCEGTLSWTGISPGSTVTGSFTVKNIGDTGSLLDWEIASEPDWGTWTFDPEEGEDLTPEDGEVTVNVTVIAPDDPNTEFSGDVKVVNKDDPSDNCIIPVYLKTPVNQQSSIVLSALSTNLMTSSLLSRMISIKMLFFTKIQ